MVEKGILDEDTFEIIMYDLQCIEFDHSNDNNKYHYDMLKDNLHDLFGIKNPHNDDDNDYVEDEHDD